MKERNITVTIYKNRKNSEAATVQPEKSTIWSRIKRLLKL